MAGIPSWVGYSCIVWATMNGFLQSTALTAWAFTRLKIRLWEGAKVPGLSQKTVP